MSSSKSDSNSISLSGVESDPLKVGVSHGKSSLNVDSPPANAKRWWLDTQKHQKDNPWHQSDAFERELGLYGAGIGDGTLKLSREKLLIEEYYTLACSQSDSNMRIDEPLKLNQEQVKATVADEMHTKSMIKDPDEFWYADVGLMDLDWQISFPSENHQKLSDTDWTGVEKSGPWWRSADREFTSSVSHKSLVCIGNRDLPQPQSNSFDRVSSSCPEDHDRRIKCATSETDDVPNYFPGNLATGSKVETPQIVGDRDCSNQFSGRQFSSDDGFSMTKSDTAETQKRLDGELCKAQLLEALCHSQTRAREAEKLAQQAYDEKEHVVKLFFRQASYLFAYRQWVHILQLESLFLQLKNKEQPKLSAPLPFPVRARQGRKGRWRPAKKRPRNPKAGISTCVVAFAVGFSLAGAGLLLGWTMGWLFPAARTIS